MKTLPKSYLFAILLVVAIILFVALSYASIIESQDIFWVTQEFIASWYIIIVFAILGGVLFGMLVAYRLISVTQFTPFEKAMLEMRGEIRIIKESFDQYQKNEIITKIRSMEKQMGTLVRHIENSESREKEQPGMPESDHGAGLPEDAGDGKTFSASTGQDRLRGKNDHD